MKKISLLLLLFAIKLPAISQEIDKRGNHNKKFSHTVGTFTDPRDGEIYKTITFIKENNKGEVLKRTWFAENSRHAVEGSYCYSDTKEYCDMFGRLYNYEQANLACPQGWHVPTIYEWKHLFHFFGGWHHSGKYLIEGKESDMDMLFGGYGTPSGKFSDIAKTGNWWDNELKDSRSAGIITLKKGTEQIFHSRIGDKHLLSCRCVQFHN